MTTPNQLSSSQAATEVGQPSTPQPNGHRRTKKKRQAPGFPPDLVSIFQTESGVLSEPPPQGLSSEQDSVIARMFLGPSHTSSPTDWCAATTLLEEAAPPDEEMSGWVDAERALLRDITRTQGTKILTREEEFQLGRKIEYGRAAMIGGFCYASSDARIMQDFYEGIVAGSTPLENVYTTFLATAAVDARDILDLEQEPQQTAHGVSDFETDHESPNTHDEEGPLSSQKGESIAALSDEKAQVVQAAATAAAERFECLTLILGQLESTQRSKKPIDKQTAKAWKTAKEQAVTSALALPPRQEFIQEFQNPERDPPLSSIGRTRTAKGLARYNSALSELFHCNLRRICKEAFRLRGRGVPVADLIINAYPDVIKTIERWDYKRGLRFGTYLTWWLRKGMYRTVDDTARTIRLPVPAHEKFRKIKYHEDEFTREHGRPPDMRELATATGMEIENLKKFLNTFRRVGSLQDPAAPDSTTELGDLIPDHKVIDPAEAYVRAQTAEKIQQLMECLKPREAKILNKRYGVTDGQLHTLEEVGEEFGISRERVRQIEAQAFRKIKQRAAFLKLNAHEL